VLSVVDDEGLQANAQARGEQLRAGLHRLQARHSLIGDVRGCGLILGFELVRDRVTREPVVEEGERIHRRIRDAGVIMVKGSATRNTFRINPPMCITQDDCEMLLDVLERAFAAG
jgi:4-aminobutyrate aminotransferase-like enzyme